MNSFARAAFAAFAAATISGGAAPADPAGLWTTPKGVVRVADCGAGLCATVVSLKKPTTDEGKPMLDIHNPDEGKRDRPIVGLSVLTDMKPDGGQWRGQVYNPEDGRTYSAFLTEQGADKLRIQGCALGGLLCKTQIWKRAG